MARAVVEKIIQKKDNSPQKNHKVQQNIFSSEILEEDTEEKHEYQDKLKMVENPIVEDYSMVVSCKNCQRKFYRNFDRELLVQIFGCWHVVCQPCINKYINAQFVNNGGQLKCLERNCKAIIDNEQVKGLIGVQKFSSLQEKSVRKMCNISRCFKCKTEIELLEGNPKDAPKKDLNGKQILIEYAKDYAVNRFCCPNGGCKTEQCKSCQASPYHLGMTCKQYKARQLLKKCRYCGEPLTQQNFSFSKVKAFSDICNSKECQQSAKMACSKINPCGHPCYGFQGEKSCLFCLKQQCASKNEELKGVNADQYCSVCYVEALSAGPCIRIGCGHIFHLKCLKKRFQIKWLTPRILFNFCLCPLCKMWIQVIESSQLYKLSIDNKQLYQKIQKMSLERLKYEQLEKSDPKLTDKSSSYHGKPMEYALAIYAYFMCFKCKNPYFGGRKNCAQMMNEGQNAAGGYDVKELVCANCCQIPIKDCPKHGKDFIQFKCKFCCNVAQWFCWGNTHFCQSCHKKQCNGDYVSKYTKDKLPKCKGAGECPIGGNHDGNGEQQMLGCAICRNMKQNSRAF